MSAPALGRAELIVRVIAQTAVDNEKYFCELDAVVGDGDFGYSLARGFENVLSGWDDLEYEDAGGLLKKTAIVLTKRIGGTSGPIWGTAFLRAGRISLRQSAAKRRRRRRGPARRDRGRQAARQLRPRRQDAARRAGAGGRRARGRAGRGHRDGARACRDHRAAERRGHGGHARATRAGVVHGRAQPRLGGRGRGWCRGHVRSRERGVAGVRAGTDLSGPAVPGRETTREERP